MPNAPTDPTEWTTYFDGIWELTDWLDEYATVYHRPGTTAEQTYTSTPTLDDRLEPDVVVDFDEHDDIVTCFFVDAESIKDFTHALTPSGRLGEYSLSPDSVTITPPNADVPQSPDGDLLVTQFAPFGSVLFDTIDVRSPDANAGMDNISTSDDFLTFFIGNILNRNLTTAKHNLETPYDYDPFDAYHGLLAGSPFGKGTREMPTALLSPHPEKHDFWYAYWERYNKWH